MPKNEELTARAGEADFVNRETDGIDRSGVLSKSLSFRSCHPSYVRYCYNIGRSTSREAEEAEFLVLSFQGSDL